MRELGVVGLYPAQTGDERLDATLIELSFELRGPVATALVLVGKRLPRQLPQVLPGVTEIDDLDRAGKVQAAPSPRTTFWRARLQPRRQASAKRRRRART